MNWNDVSTLALLILWLCMVAGFLYAFAWGGKPTPCPKFPPGTKIRVSGIMLGEDTPFMQQEYETPGRKDVPSGGREPIRVKCQTG